jgi:hypothetical protein
MTEEPSVPSSTDPLTIFNFNRSSAPRLFAIIDRLEQALGLPHAFYERLVDGDDDWSFVLRVHALMEASLTTLLSERIGGRDLPDMSKLTNALSHLEMSRVHVGKVELAFTLGLIGDRDRLFLRTLSEFRNTFVHDIKNVTLKLVDHVAAFDKNQRRNFANALYDTPTDHMTAVAVTHPRRTIWFISFMLLRHLRFQFEALQVARGAPGTNRAEFFREGEQLSRDMDSLLRRAKKETGRGGEVTP